MNNVVATAIFAKTESGDNYIWCVKGFVDKYELDEFFKDKMGDESEYVCDWEIDYLEESK